MLYCSGSDDSDIEADGVTEAGNKAKTQFRSTKSGKAIIPSGVIPFKFITPNTGTTVSEAISSTWWREQLLLHPSCMPPRRGGNLWARGTASAWNSWWPDCGIWVTCRRIFRASGLSLWMLTETCSSQFHNVLTSYSIYLRISHLFVIPPCYGT